jgi:hypothetical protein
MQHHHMYITLDVIKVTNAAATYWVKHDNVNNDIV